MELGFDNWRATIGTLTEEELDLVRHDRGRKCADWTECHGYDPIKLPQKVFRKLRYVVLNAQRMPMEDLPEEVVGAIFIGQHGGRLYLINTEGYDYCRYISPVEVLKE